MSASKPWSRKRKATDKALKMLAAKMKRVSGDHADSDVVGGASGTTSVASSDIVAIPQQQKVLSSIASL